MAAPKRAAGRSILKSAKLPSTRIYKLFNKKSTYTKLSGFFVYARLMHILKLSLFFNPQVLY